MARIELTQGYYTDIDDIDLDRIVTHRWKILKSGNRRYASRTGKYLGKTATGRKRFETVLMHRFLLNMTCSTMYVDHIDGNGLNNRRSNIRIATPGQNQANRKKGPGTSAYKGVCWLKRDHLWRAQITVEGHVECLGYFKNEYDAALAYDDAAVRAYGAFAKTNNPAPSQSRLNE